MNLSVFLLPILSDGKWPCDNTFYSVVIYFIAEMKLPSPQSCIASPLQVATLLARPLDGPRDMFKKSTFSAASQDHQFALQ